MITIIAIGPDGALLSIDFFKGLELNNTVIMIMVIISAILAFASLFGYAPGFIRQLKENKEKSDRYNRRSRNCHSCNCHSCNKRIRNKRINNNRINNQST